MKTINLYVNEKLSIDNFTKKEKPNYTCRPENKSALIKIIYDRVLKDNDANLNDIDVSLITDMRDLFSNDSYDLKKYIHNIDISQWDVSNVKDMSCMFKGCEYFNCDLSDWDTHSCKDMFGMFFNCKKFMSDLSFWDVSQVVSFKSMFYNCKEFNSDLKGWKLDKCDDLSYMFSGCEKFNHDLSMWDLTDKRCEFMFRNTKMNKKKFPKGIIK